MYYINKFYEVIETYYSYQYKPSHKKNIEHKKIELKFFAVNENLDNSLLRIPYVIHSIIVTYLDLNDLHALTKTCRVFYNIVRSPLMWTSYYQSHWGKPLGKIEKIEWKNVERELALRNTTFPPLKNQMSHQAAVTHLFVNESSLYTFAKDLHFVQWDIFNGKKRNDILLNRTPNDVILTDQYSLFASNLIEYIPRNLDAPKQHIKLGKFSISTIFKDPFLSDYVIGGTENGFLKSWKLNPIQEYQSFKSKHLNHISKILVTENNVYSAGWDAIIKLWDKESGQCVSELKGHSHEIETVELINTLILSGSYDHQIKLWDTRQKKQVFDFNCHQQVVNQLCVNDPLFCSASWDGVVAIWDLRNNEIPLHRYKEHTKKISQLKSCNYLFISSSYDNQIKMWDSFADSSVKTIKLDIGGISTFLYKDEFVVAGGMDGQIITWRG